MASTPAEYYLYRPLQQGCIRLIRLHQGPRGSGPARDMVIELEDHSLDTSGYHALSYTWGPPTLEEQDAAELQIFTAVHRCYPVFCQGKIILVTRSLGDALRRMRVLFSLEAAEYVSSQTKGRVSQTQLIWADGICINQSDLQERAKQVTLMAEVYANANLTLAYVGEPDEHSSRTRKALDLTVSLAQLCQELLSTNAMEHITTEDAEDANLYASVGAKVPSTEDWMEWAIFMTREWFSRTWVLQEAVLSGATNMFVVCGTLFVQADVLMLSLNMIYGSRWDRYILIQLKSASQSDERYNRYTDRILGWLATTHPHHWVNKAWHTKGKPSFYSMSRWQLDKTSCSDPRDKIYGTLGIAAERQNLDQSLLPVDFRLSVREVFCRATLYIIRQTKTLDILSTVATRRLGARRCVLPSWCPDYDGVGGRQAPTMLMDYPGDAQTVWRASQSSICKSLGGTTVLSKLVVQGVRCDEVEIICPFNNSLIPFVSTTIIDFILQVMEGAHVSASHPSCQLGGVASPDQVSGTVRLISPAVSDVACKIDPTSASSSMIESCARAVTLYGRVDTTGGKWSLLSADGDLEGLAPAMTYHALCMRLWDDAQTGLKPGISPMDNDPERNAAIIERLAASVQAIIKIDRKAARHLPYCNFLRKEVSLNRRVRSSGKAVKDLDVEAGLLSRMPFVDGSDDVIKFSRAFWTMSSACSGRSLFLTKGGRIGIGHETLQAGDQVWLLAGAKVPFLLRKNSNGDTELVGETYVDGMMLGELWSANEDVLNDVELV